MPTGMMGDRAAVAAPEEIIEVVVDIAFEEWAAGSEIAF
jgi:hypothetical protein